MSGGNGLRSGGQVLVDQLRIHGVDTIFCVPGESYLTVIDALHDAQNEIKTVACRQEGGATNMAAHRVARPAAAPLRVPPARHAHTTRSYAADHR